MTEARRTRKLAWLISGLAAVSTPVLILGAANAPSPAIRAMAAAPIRPADAPPLDVALARQVFSQTTSAETEPAADQGVSEAGLEPPELIGIVGRLPDNAVALVRAADGRTRTLGMQDSIDGWRLAALSIDAAFFTRGSERVRVELPPEQ